MPGPRALARAVRMLAPHVADAAVHARWLADAARAHADPAATLMHMARRVARGEPLAYVLGSQPFGELDLVVRAPVLIPRPETEEWALAAARMVAEDAARGPVHVLDLCTGSGCIALLIAHRLRQARVPWRVTAVDSEPAAVALAAENAARIGARVGVRDGYVAGALAGGEVRILQADVYSAADMARVAALAGARPTLVCNPPYIAAGDYAALDDSVRLFEARAALVGDAARPNEDGLAFYRRLAELVEGPLRVRRVIVEVGAGQAARVAALFRGRIWRDAWGVERVVSYEVE